MAQLDLLVEPAVHKARKKLPGHVRQRIKRAISSLAEDPRPHDVGEERRQQGPSDDASEDKRIAQSPAPPARHEADSAHSFWYSGSSPRA